MRRAGFSMIEVVFVIVILGIVASISMSKLFSPKTDSLVTNTLSDFNTAILSKIQQTACMTEGKKTAGTTASMGTKM